VEHVVQVEVEEQLAQFEGQALQELEADT